VAHWNSSEAAWATPVHLLLCVFTGEFIIQFIHSFRAFNSLDILNGTKSSQLVWVNV
jgi:hypothetical protein